MAAEQLWPQDSSASIHNPRLHGQPRGGSSAARQGSLKTDIGALEAMAVGCPWGGGAAEGGG